MGQWKATISEIEFIRVEKYGDPYDAMVTFKVIDGEVRGVRMMAKDNKPFTREDYQEIEGILAEYGVKAYKMGRYKDGELRILTRRIDDRRSKDRRK